MSRELPENLFELDGRLGEGGGQVLRTTLSLSMMTGRPVRLDHIRGGRRSSGLKRQHLACVRAAKAVSDARTDGDELTSESLTFTPRHLRAGDYEFKVGSAGSAILVLQTVLTPLLFAEGTSRLRIHGGTHNAWAPCADFFALTFLPQLRSMGARVEFELERVGFFPAGGGTLNVTVHPLETPAPFELHERGNPLGHYALIRRAHLDADIADREWQAIAKYLYWKSESRRDVDHPESQGPGNSVHVVLGFESVTEVFSAFGSKGRGAKHVGTEAAKSARQFIDAGIPVGRHLADQLILPMAMIAGGGFSTLGPSKHTSTNAEVINRFLGDGVVQIEEGTDGVASVRVAPPS